MTPIFHSTALFPNSNTFSNLNPILRYSLININIFKRELINNHKQLSGGGVNQYYGVCTLVRQEATNWSTVDQR